MSRVAPTRLGVIIRDPREVLKSETMYPYQCKKSWCWEKRSSGRAYLKFSETHLQDIIEYYNAIFDAFLRHTGNRTVRVGF